ncbi:hypothetical protein [Acidovorax sp.]|uniref:hypothetical protein n=1 Tax=Acidovorax sp. TaxID=1872122 RepID=UPI002ACEE7D3|nr:hypothetical protein [Acidovorax sp.]MDZ7865143.1 hypothetical protein [Acidovorax sp.]
MIPPTTTPLPCPAGHVAGPLSRHHHGFLATAGLALALVLASPAASWAQPAAAPAATAPAAKVAPKLSKSYFERVEELQGQVSEGKLAELGGTIVPTTERKTFEVEKLNDDQTWWQYEDDTTFIHMENSTGQTIAGVVLAFWIDSCQEKKQPPNIVHVRLKKPLRKNAQAVVVIPPSKLLHTKNEVSCLSVRGAWGQ